MSSSSSLQKVAAWRARLARFSRARQTVAAFCDSEGVSVPTFYQWKRRLTAVLSDGNRQEPRLGARARRESHRGRVLPTARRVFLPVQIAAGLAVEIDLPNGACVRIPVDAIDALAHAIQAAGQTPSGTLHEVMS